MTTAESTVEVLLDRHGRTFAAEAGIRMDRATPSPLFRLLCLSVLISARISADTAMQASRALADAGWTTAPKLAGATWERRTKVLNDAGYARYDESTSRYLGEDAEMVVDRYGGDLRRLRDEAGGDATALHEALTAFKGIGDVGADFFRREVQGAWSEYAPFLDDRAASSAAALGLPEHAAELYELTDGPDEFVRLVAALVRTQLGGSHDEVRAEAAER